MIALNSESVSWAEWFNAATAFIESHQLTGYMLRQLRAAWHAGEDPCDYAEPLKVVLAHKTLLTDARDTLHRIGGWAS